MLLNYIISNKQFIYLFFRFLSKLKRISVLCIFYNHSTIRIILNVKIIFLPFRTIENTSNLCNKNKSLNIPMENAI